MIAVDTSALLAVILNESEKNRCIQALGSSQRLVISAATHVEAQIVAAGRNMDAEVASLLDRFQFDVVEVDEARAHRIGDAYRRFGRGFHPARLNFGDCFAYELAISLDCPLLYVGNDFALTDVRAALTASP